MQLRTQRRQFLSAVLASNATCLFNSHHLAAVNRPARKIKEVQYKIFRGNAIKLLKLRRQVIHSQWGDILSEALQNA